jgi:hypothetical protein
VTRVVPSSIVGTTSTSDFVSHLKWLSVTDKVKATIDHLDFDQRQKLLRLVIDQVRVQGWQIERHCQVNLAVVYHVA